MKRGERPEGGEGDEVREESLEEFRERALEYDESSAPEGSGPEEEKPDVHSGGEEPEGQGYPGQEGTDPKDAEAEYLRKEEVLSDEDLEEFRKRILEEYGPDGLGDSTLEGQLYGMAIEERAESEDASDSGTTQEGEGVEDKTTEGSSEFGEDSADTQASKGSGTQASAETEKAAESRRLEALANEESEDKGEAKRTAQKDESVDRPHQTSEAEEGGNLVRDAGPKVESQEFEERAPNLASEASVSAAHPDASAPEPLDNPELRSLDQSETPPIQVGFENQRPMTVQVASGDPEGASVDVRDDSTISHAPDGGSFVSPENKLPTSVVGSLDRNEDQIVVTERGNAPDKALPVSALQTSDLHHFPAGSDVRAKPEAEEVRTLEAVDYGRGVVVRIPKSDLENAGAELEAGQNKILELGLRNVGTEDVEKVYARYVASNSRAEVHVGDIGGEKGSKYELVEAKEYDEDRFVRDFQRGKCEHLQNVNLEHVDERILVAVDNRRVELEACRLSTSGSHVIMRGKLNGESDCKIEFDGRRSSVRFGRDYPVEGMRMEGDDLVVRYAPSRNASYEHRICLEHLETPEKPSLNQFDKREFLQHVERFDHPERIEGLYQFVLDKAAEDEIRRLLDDARRRGGNEYGHVKAEISERLVPNLLELAGWEKIKWHPFGETMHDASRANGTDWLLRTPDKRVVLAEIKWYEDCGDATRKAAVQVANYFREHQDDPNLKLDGAYIAIMDYHEDNGDGSPIRVHVLRVRTSEELR